MSKTHSGVAFGLGEPRSEYVTAMSFEFSGLTEMFPSDDQRMWCPQTVWRKITEYGVSLMPSSRWATGTGAANETPPLVDFATITCESKSNGTS